MAAENQMRWLPAAALERLARVEFAARGAVDGFTAGRHRSVRKGASSEFAEHRAYQPGDDLRKLDWKLVARRQRLFVREFVDETNLRATIALDCSGSMSYRGEQSVGGLDKFDYARHLAASLAYLLVRQQDGAGLVTFDTAVRQYLPAKATPAQIRQVLEVVDGAKAAGETDAAAVLHDVAERIPQRGVVFVISDLFGDAEELLKALHHFRFRHHEVILLQVLAEEERTFPFEEMLEFKDAETSMRLNVDAAAIRRDYLARFETWQEKLRRGAGEMSVTHVILSTARPFDEALADILVRSRGK